MSTSKLKTINFKISLMHCASCASNCERVLKKTPGVASAQVSYASEEAVVTFDPHRTQLEFLSQAVSSLGYTAHLPTSESADSHHAHGHNDLTDLTWLKKQLIVGGILTFILLTGAMLPSAPSFIKDPRTMLLLATPVQFWLGARFYKSSFQAMRQGLTNMDTLIVLGTSVAYFYSLQWFCSKIILCPKVYPTTYISRPPRLLLFLFSLVNT